MTLHLTWRTNRRVTLLLGLGAVGTAVALLAAALVAAEVDHVYFDRRDLPDLGAFVRFELPTGGHVYDADGRPIVELAREPRAITRYEDLPPVVQDAILAAEDKRFFSHNGVDYFSLPRVLGKARVGTLVGRLARGGRGNGPAGAAPFPQGGSTITQQLVRGTFLRDVTAAENSNRLHHAGPAASLLSWAMGARAVNMLARKREEIRLSVWLEQQMREQFGSKRRAKEEILARYASLVYMGNGQYGFARAAEYYFGRPLATFTVADADKAAVLAGIPKSPREYAPGAANGDRVVRRRNQTLALMQADGFLSPQAAAQARGRALRVAPHAARPELQASAVVGHVVAELGTHADLGLEDLLAGRIDVYATASTRVQHLASDALEHGLAQYEHRHPKARGLLQGSVVVLRNRDAGILAETGGRQVFHGRSAAYSDYNRATRSLRQPGSAMKPIVYLAAFQTGGFTLDTPVPDEPIAVPNGETQPLKWISNYDGRFEGLIPIRQALAESRNAVAMWIGEQVGIDRIARTSTTLGIRTPLARYPTTALGASELTLLELANAYRAMASGIDADPYVIQRIVRSSGGIVPSARRSPQPAAIDPLALSLIQEGLRGVVLLPTGTAHALAGRGFPIAVMGKTGTTNDFRDALFVGSTYGPDGITVAVRIGFDDDRSLGSSETGARVALPIFEELMRAVYRDQLVGAVPAFPPAMDARIAASLLPPAPLPATDPLGHAVASSFDARPMSSAAATWLLRGAADGYVPLAVPNAAPQTVR